MLGHPAKVLLPCGAYRFESCLRRMNEKDEKITEELMEKYSELLEDLGNEKKDDL